MFTTSTYWIIVFVLTIIFMFTKVTKKVPDGRSRTGKREVRVRYSFKQNVISSLIVANICAVIIYLIYKQLY
jgi:uncharacterized membrane protein